MNLKTAPSHYNIIKIVSVSFFGASHIAMPLQEAKISTNIRLRFRTHQESALLLLAAGRTDYCLVGLDSGRIKFLFKVDDFVAEVRYNIHVNLSNLLY